MRISLTVNGIPRRIEAPPLRRLLDILRDDLGLTGTKEGCGEGECGACAVLIDGTLVNACLVPALQLEGRSVVTIEGLGDEPDPVRLAFLDEGAVQCGFCTPGMVLATHALLQANPRPSPLEIREGLAGNICRCTGYSKIVRAVERASLAVAPVRARVLPPARAPLPAAADAVGAPAAPSAPRSLADALAFLAQEGSSPVVPIAGATDLMTGNPQPGRLPDVRQSRVLDLSGIAELQDIRRTDDHLEIGACVTLLHLSLDPDVARYAPALRQSALLFGAPAIRNRATVGGNVMSASPAADLPPVFIALDAAARLASVRGVRDVPMSEFYPGYRRTAIQPDEILVAIRIPLACENLRQAFHKVGTRRAQSIAKASLAAAISLDDRGFVRRIRLAAGSVAPTPILLAATCAAMNGRLLDADAIRDAASIARDEVEPIDDVRSTSRYRRTVIGRLVRRFLEGSVT
jgi:xanthine dehydrogenase small subunit